MPHFARPGNLSASRPQPVDRAGAIGEGGGASRYAWASASSVSARSSLAIPTSRPQGDRMSRLRKILLAATVVAVIVVAAAAAFMTFWPSFGGTLTGPRLAQARASPQHKG